MEIKSKDGWIDYVIICGKYELEEFIKKCMGRFLSTGLEIRFTEMNGNAMTAIFTNLLNPQVKIMYAYKGLNPYSLYFEDQYGILVFAHTAREAKKVGYANLLGYEDCDYVDIKVKLLRDSNHLMKYKKSEDPHFVDTNLEGCPYCLSWVGIIYEENCSICKDQIDY